MTRPGRHEVLRWLREESPAALEALWRRADRVRLEHVGDAVHLRGLVEVSNHCARRCAYCGISAAVPGLPRYRMSAPEVLACAREAARRDYGTVVLQGGEDPGLTRAGVASVVRAVREETGLAVTLSLGERSEADLAAWREAGADRYLLRFETSDPALFRRLHPALPGGAEDRFALLGTLRRLTYEVGSGVMVGLPGQSFESLADDIMAFSALDLDMVGVGPYVAHPATPLGRGPVPEGAFAGQVPASVAMALKVVALTRLACPDANIPAATALAAVEGGEATAAALRRGANVVMPDLTPLAYRALYDLYPGKSRVPDAGPDGAERAAAAIVAVGRRVGTGPGGRRR